MSLYETGVRQILDDYLIEESKKERDYGDYWSASSAGYCMRRLIFERLGVPKTKDDDARLQRVFTAGHIFHEFLQRLTKKTGVSIAQEVELIDDSIMVKGHFDDLILVPELGKTELGATTVGIEQDKDGVVRPKQKLILYDYKTANSKSFDYKKEMSHYHKMQLSTYMYMARKDYEDLDEGRILILEKDTLRTKEFVLYWSPQLEKEIVGYWRTLNGYWNNKTMPRCTCADYEGGFLAREKFNPYFYNGEPCSIEYYKKWKEENSENNKNKR